MMQVPLEMPAPAAVPSVQIIRAVLREYHAATHTAEVEPVLGPASLVGEIPVLMSCRPDLLTTGREVAVLTWSDVGGLVLGPYGGVPGDPPNADDADKVDGIHAANTPTASKLLAMDANAKFPAHTVAGNLTIQGYAQLQGRRRCIYTFGPTGYNASERKLQVSRSGYDGSRSTSLYVISFSVRGNANQHLCELWFFSVQQKHSGSGGDFTVLCSRIAGSSYISYTTVTNQQNSFLGEFSWTYDDGVSVTVDEMTQGQASRPSFEVV